MNWYHVILVVACGATLDTGERIETEVQARDRLDAAITAEASADAVLGDAIHYTHAAQVRLLSRPAALVLAA